MRTDLVAVVLACVLSVLLAGTSAYSKHYYKYRNWNDNGECDNHNHKHKPMKPEPDYRDYGQKFIKPISEYPAYDRKSYNRLNSYDRPNPENEPMPYKKPKPDYSDYDEGVNEFNKPLNDEAKIENEVIKEPKPRKMSTYSRLYQYLLKKEKPWLLLPNSNQCYQQWCKSSNDCCRGYNICDTSAKVCIDCWWGYPCRTSANCCENNPVCKKDYGEDYGQCVRKGE